MYFIVIILDGSCIYNRTLLGVAVRLACRVSRGDDTDEPRRIVAGTGHRACQDRASSGSPSVATWLRCAATRQLARHSIWGSRWTFFPMRLERCLYRTVLVHLRLRPAPCCAGDDGGEVCQGGGKGGVDKGKMSNQSNSSYRDSWILLGTSNQLP